MKKKDLYSIAFALKLAKDNSDKAYNEFTEMNKDVLTSIEAINAQYDEDRLSIINEFCEKTDDGKPLIEKNNYVIPESVQGEVNSRINELSKKAESDFNLELEKEI